MNLDTYKTTVDHRVVERGPNHDENAEAHLPSAPSGEGRVGTQLEVSTENTESLFQGES
jgi:hypothetical protein